MAIAPLIQLMLGADGVRLATSGARDFYEWLIPGVEAGPDP